MAHSIYFLIAAFILLVSFIALSYGLSNIRSNLMQSEDVPDHDRKGIERKLSALAYGKGLVYFAIVVVSIFGLAAIYGMIKETIWEGHFHEWLNLIVRWIHITFGIAWIGTSFYFVFLENALNRTKNIRDELAGDLWAVHGGGFYYLEKYKVAPKVIPRELHWFKYEAYFTWVSGFCLLIIVYYFNAKSFLIDPNVMTLSDMHAIVIGIGSLILGWMIYDRICRTRIIHHPVIFTIVGFVLACGFAWGYSQLFSGRASYMHFGAMLGTLMAGNVFFVIIPSQKAMVNAAKSGVAPDPTLGKFAGLRSLHNNYLTLPVLFVMISNHFPSTFSHDHQWLILALISVGSAGIKHYLNLREKGKQSVWIMPISILILFSAVFMTAPKPRGQCESNISFTQIYTIFQDRCNSCHSSKPTDDLWTSPPNGVVYDTPEDILKMTTEIMQRVVLTETMPQNNKTGITPEEREMIRCWIDQGTPVTE